MKPIYEDPNHPQYGPVRRLHVMCMQLFPNFAEVERRFEILANGEHWSERVATRVAAGIPEATAQRDMLRWFLSIHR